jgi:radical SAM protein with 4Fe4S-binding SPASM domain
MTSGPLSLILLPTTACNAACEYCFERRGAGELDLETYHDVLRKILDFMDQRGARTLLVYWQGGEVMMLPPSYFERAHDMAQALAEARQVEIRHFLQSNMIMYTNDWDRTIARVFDNGVGSSMDYPNLHRILPGGTPEEFETIWREKVRQAQDAGIHVGAISIPNRETCRIGAERFYTYFVDELHISDFQVNIPFPGGPPTAAKREYPLDTEALGRFLTDLFDIWIERGLDQGVSVGPFDRLLEFFIEGSAALPCIWRENCANEFFCVDPRGHVAQCDCWVSSYPEFWFGNLLEADSLTSLLQRSAAYQRFRERPAAVIRNEDCLDCDYLASCHGGCPVRTYSVRGELARKDPNCEIYKIIFRRVQSAAAGIALRRSGAAVAPVKGPLAMDVAV